MSKQYLTSVHVEDAHKVDIFGLEAIRESRIITVSGDSCVKIWEYNSSNCSIIYEFPGAHKLGAHHVAVSENSEVAATVGFDGGIIMWDLVHLQQRLRIDDTDGIWAVALSSNGDRLYSTTCEGQINVWDVAKSSEKIKVYSTKGSFGLCIDISPDGNAIATGHENGGIYIFNEAISRIHHSLQGIVKPVRQVKFSPGGKLLAAGGDSLIVALFDVISGEQVASLSGHSSWVFSISWNSTGEYLVTSSLEGKVKVWSIDTQSCIATQNESSGAVYSVAWIQRFPGGGEGFVTTGSNKSLIFYREGTGDKSGA